MIRIVDNVGGVATQQTIIYIIIHYYMYTESMIGGSPSIVCPPELISEKNANNLAVLYAVVTGFASIDCA